MENFYTRLCKNCGSALVFDPQKQKLVCPACGTEAEADEMKGENVVELDLMDTLKAIEQYNEDDDKLVVHCPNCGAEAAVTQSACKVCGSSLEVPSSENAFSGAVHRLSVGAFTAPGDGNKDTGI